MATKHTTALDILVSTENSIENRVLASNSTFFVADGQILVQKPPEPFYEPFREQMCDYEEAKALDDHDFCQADKDFNTILQNFFAPSDLGRTIHDKCKSFDPLTVDHLTNNRFEDDAAAIHGMPVSLPVIYRHSEVEKALTITGRILQDITTA